MNATTKFEAGKTYFGRSICDSECIYRMFVRGRTEKTITVSVNGGQLKRLRPRVYRDVETVQPNGNYSMALVIAADRPVQS